MPLNVRANTVKDNATTRIALTIAGSDSGGGAGIQADLKTFARFGVFGTSAITSVTAQNTLGVRAIHDIPPGIVGEQIDAVLSDIGADAVKTGMLSNSAIVKTVTEKLAQYGVRNLVVDPVMVAKGGERLLRDEAVEALKENLLPLALIVTPNTEEAAVLAGFAVNDEKEMERAARVIHGLGPKYVLVKGGHLQGDAVDILYDGERFKRYSSERIDTRHTHGTGCTYAAAIAANLALGKDAGEAVGISKRYITAAIRSAPRIGGGRGPVNHSAVF